MSRKNPASWAGRSSVRIAAAAGAGALALAACGGSSGGSSSSGSGSSSASGSATSGTISWSASPIAGAGATDTRTVLIKAFEKAYPKIKVNLISANSNTDTNRATLVNQISGGSSSPDVFMGDVIWPAQFGEHQLAIPLSKYLPSSYWSQFAQGLVKGATYKGQVYGSPLFEDQGFLYYRKDLLAKYHLSPPKTWEQLESEAKEVQSKAHIKYGFVWQGADYEGLTCNFMEYLTDAGGTVTNSGYTKSTLNSPAAVKAATFMRSLVTSGVTPSAITSFEEAQAMDAFAAGQAVFLRNWDYAYAYANTPSESKIVGKAGVEPPPTFAGQPTPGYSNIGGWNLYINPHSTHIKTDLTFIKWMSSNAAEEILAKDYSLIPTTNAVRNMSSITSKNAVLSIITKTKLVPRPAGTPNYPQVSTAIYNNINAVLAGSATPANAIKTAGTSIQSALTAKASGL